MDRLVCKPLLALCLVAFAVPAPASDATAVAEWQRQFAGTYTGATTCGAQSTLELKVDKVEPLGPQLLVRGSLKVTPRGGTKGDFEIGVMGAINPARTVLLAGWHLEVGNPNCVLTIGGRCVLEEGGVGIFKPMIEKRRAELVKKAAFHLEALRDADGQGWQGTIRGTFFRVGNALTIPFFAQLARQGSGEFGVVRLCYDDTTSGGRDCTR